MHLGWGCGVGWIPVTGQERRGHLGRSWPEQGSEMDKRRCSLNSLLELTELTACVADTELSTKDTGSGEGYKPIWLWALLSQSLQSHREKQALK